MSLEIFKQMESEVRSYCRKYPTVFQYAKNAKLIDENGKEYIDFLAVAGSMNYGHNNPFIKNEIQQEPDASSFPNGGIRNTFEARGYSAFVISFYHQKTVALDRVVVIVLM